MPWGGETKRSFGGVGLLFLIYARVLITYGVFGTIAVGAVVVDRTIKIYEEQRRVINDEMMIV
jgi:hypothetical protein